MSSDSDVPESYGLLGNTAVDSTESDSLSKQLKMLNSAISDKPPYCSGVLPVSAEDLILYYGKDKIAKRIDFSNATDVELEELCAACDPATFGCKNKDVLDESYRKAYKLDSSAFATNFDVMQSGLIDAIRNDLLEGYRSTKQIQAELTKLNVYGPGQFFKVHKDTPRGRYMLGSLVVVFPTKHDGGSLIFSLDDKQWEFETSSLHQLSQSSGSRVAYTAFYSDVDHEVKQVLSGYRVTLTYNLHVQEKDLYLALEPIIRQDEIDFRNVLKSLLEDPTFLPTGGTLGFGLRHQYAGKDMNELIKDLHHCVKGSDAIVYRVCTELGLGVRFRVFYHNPYEGHQVLLGKGFPTEDSVFDVYETEFWYALMEHGGSVIKGPGKGRRYEVHWVTDLTNFNQHRLVCSMYGNEAYTEFQYGFVCLIVGVGPKDDRAAGSQQERP